MRPPRAAYPYRMMYEDYRNWFASTGLRGQLGRKQFANRVEAARVAKSSRRSQGYFFDECGACDERAKCTKCTLHSFF